VDDVREQIQVPAGRNRAEEVARLDRTAGGETGGFDPPSPTATDSRSKRMPRAAGWAERMAMSSVPWPPPTSTTVPAREKS
jgi:hypothetical protein